MLRFKLNNSKSSVSPHRALLLPEVLERILSYLNYNHLSSARLVCQQWHTASQHLVRKTVQWNDTSPPEERSIALKRLYNAYSLQCITGDETGVRSKTEWQLWKQQAWRDLYESVDALVSATDPTSISFLAMKARGGLALKKLVILGGTGSDSSMLRMISQFESLTILRIQGTTGAQTDLGHFLRSCQNLLEIYVEPEGSRCTPILTSADHIESDDDQGCKGKENYGDSKNPGSLQVFKLQTLELRNFFLYHQDTLEHHLTCLPNLRTLKLVRVQCMPPEDGRIGKPLRDQGRFWSHVADHCPKLEGLHFSVLGKPLAHMDIVDMAKKLPAVKEWSIGLSNLTWSTIDALQSYAGTATMMSDNTIMGVAFSPVTAHIPFLMSPTISTNHLTSLEILQDSHSYSVDKLRACALHNFLCSAPSLLHLRATAILLPVEYFDVSSPNLVYPMPHHGYDEVDIDYESEEDGAMLIAPGGTLKPYWTCHNLRTLQIGIDGPSAVHRQSGPNARWSRLVFSYISRLCPFIQDLHIRQKSIPISLEGGLCILSKLKDLVALVLHVLEVVDLKEARDIAWMRQAPSTFDKFKQSVGFGRLSSKSSDVYQPKCPQVGARYFFPESFPMLAPNTPLSVDEARAMYGTAAVQSTLKALKQDRNGGCIWPQMEIFHIKVDGTMHRLYESIEHVLQPRLPLVDVVVASW